MLRIATIYCNELGVNFDTYSMDNLRFRRIAEKLADLGLAVDFIVNHNDEIIPLDNNMRFVCYKKEHIWKITILLKPLFIRV